MEFDFVHISVLIRMVYMEEERANKHENIKTITVVSKLLFSIENLSSI